MLGQEAKGRSQTLRLVSLVDEYMCGKTVGTAKVGCIFTIQYLIVEILRLDYSQVVRQRTLTPSFRWFKSS